MAIAFKQFKPSLAHQKEDLIKYSSALDEVFKLLPQNADIIKKERLIEQLSALGRIHEVQKAA